MAAIRAAASLATGRAAGAPAVVLGGMRGGLAAATTTSPVQLPGRLAARSAAASAAGPPDPPPPPAPLIDSAGRAKAEAYLDATLAANATLNLTAVKGRAPALARHIADSLDFLPPLDALANSRAGGADGGGGGGGGGAFSVIDVGAGAGFPGAVLAAARPAWRVTLLDALRKRTDFAVGAARQAGLGNAVPVWGRAEDVGRGGGEEGGKAKGKRGGGGGGGRDVAGPTPAAATATATAAAPPGSHRELHDAAVARAVAETRVLAELCLPLVRHGGLWLAAKGPDPAAEVEAAAGAIRELGGAVEALLPLPPLTLGGPARSLLVVRKVGRTPEKYPRRAGMPGKRPL